MLELIGVALFIGSIATVAAVAKRTRQPSEIRSPNPADFELTAIESYNRLLKFLSAGQIGKHTWKVVETVDPLYIVAEINYQDDAGGKCHARVTFDVVEGFERSTTIRWSCRFLKPCDRNVASKMEQLLDSWIQTCLMPQLVVPPSAMHTQLLDPIEVKLPELAAENKHARALKDAMFPVQDLIAKNLTRPSNKRSPDPVQFDVPLVDAYKRLCEVMARGEVGEYKWEIKEQIEDAFITARLKFKDKKRKLATSSIVNFDISATSNESISILWSCEFEQWCDEETGARIVLAINAWLTAALIAQKEKTSDALRIPRSLDIPLVSNLKSSYPKEFAYLKLLPKLSKPDDINTKWKLIECHEGSSISAKVEHRSLKKAGATCAANVHVEFYETAAGCEIKTTYRFTPDSDLDIFEDFQHITDEWMQLVIRRY